MKTKTFAKFFLAAALLLSFAGVSIAEEGRESNPRFKGVELYSWKNAQNEWVFALLNGTNRLKTTDEIKGSKTLIKGVDSLNKTLGNLAKNEWVFWSNDLVKGFEFPPKADREAILKAAQKAGINLNIDDGKK